MRRNMKGQEKYDVVYKKFWRSTKLILSTYDFSTLYTTRTLPNNFIIETLLDLIERTIKRVETLYLACTITIRISIE